MKMKKFALRGLLILAIVVALCMFFSGTVRTLTTPKVRFAQAKNGKFEQEIELKGKVVFPESEEIRVPVPEDLSLTITQVKAAAGDQVKAGAVLLKARVTDAEKTLETLKKDYDTAQKELRSLEKKNGEIRLTRNEEIWQEAWLEEEKARETERSAWVALRVSLLRENLEMQGENLPEGAGEESRNAYQAWQTAGEALKRAEDQLKAMERYAIPEETWTSLRQMEEYREKLQKTEEQMTAVQVLSQTAETIPAPHAGYVIEVKVEKGATADGDTVLARMTPDGVAPVIRLDLTGIKQSVNQGTTVIVDSDSWGGASTKVVSTGLDSEGHPYADAAITEDVRYALGSVSNMMKGDIKARLVTKSQEATCLVPAAAVRGSGDSRYVLVGETESSAFGGSRMIAKKMSVTVLAESGSTVSVAEDLTWQKVLYMEDRALTEGGPVMQYTGESGASK